MTQHRLEMKRNRLVYASIPATEHRQAVISAELPNENKRNESFWVCFRLVRFPTEHKRYGP